VKVVDANVLLYAVNEDAPFHGESNAWLDCALSGAETVGLAWIALLAFVRLSTKSGVFPSPLSTGEAMDIVDSWLETAPAVVIGPTKHHSRLVRSLVTDAGTGGNLVSDAHLAALALEHQGIIVTYDKDFLRFDGVRSVNPRELLSEYRQRGQ